ncbi:MAG TPA: 2-phospho-L-lactate transferase [Terriglobales bacterium]|nr:2-phospho-L-lactate transferase [Terriglobales bacterium]
MIVVLTGGTGGAKFVDGLRRVVPPEELTIIVNTGDDHEWWGLYVSPDVDSIVYVLANILSTERGWGVRGDTFHCLQAMRELGEPAWFSVGDRDLATHLLRTKLMSEGQTLSQATSYIAQQLGVRACILPMSDMRVETRVDTAVGDLSFEEYFVKRWYQDPVNSVRFLGASEAVPADGVLESIAAAQAVLIAPSNPVTSIGPILAVPGIREALKTTPAQVVAVSPIIGNAAVSGPAANLMTAHGLKVSIEGIIEAYRDFLDVLVADESDASSAEALISDHLQVHCANILMRTPEDRTRIARSCVALACPEILADADANPELTASGFAKSESQ